ncbi:cyclic peptide export ABC transporter [Paraburkholderia fungorum]|uniref:cyclic peptide export ABC transporter n=1 Tax=Paraburkholderia fungorum TaxID=134537 RepID=UPI0038BA9B63
MTSNSTSTSTARAADAKPGLSHELIRLLRPFWRVTLFATLMGGIGGLSTAWLLATINDGLHAPGGASGHTIALFVVLCLVTLAGRAAAGVGNSMIGQQIIAALRKDISARIVCAPIAAIERYKVHRLIATLNGDVDTVSAFTFNFSGFAIAFAIVLGCIVYMLVLSPLLFVLAAVAIVLGLLFNRNASRRWTRHYEGVRGAQDELQKQYRAITEGAKELRLNRARRERVYGAQLSGAADTIADLKTRAMRLFWATDAASSTLFFAVIGVLLVAQYRLGVDPRVISGFVIVLLYVRGPVDQLASALPALGQAQVSFRRIAELSSQFTSREPYLLDDREGQAQEPLTMHEDITLRAASYTYASNGDVVPFSLGPVDLTIQRGETLFIVGENGCGKTTLIKLLLGLYSPSPGQLLLDGAPVPAEQIDAYRQMFSAVFSDYYLFDDLVARDPEMIARAQTWLEHLEIAHKVKVSDGVFSTIDLSAGQRKRLALVHAMLEERPVMMFDEWAADQDPTFRRVFYSEFLPELKRQGKTLIVISHDDRFFDTADRVIRLAGGKIVETTTGIELAREG